MMELHPTHVSDPKVGRFISEDPIGFRGGLNFYGYVGGNPLNRIDPSGLVSWQEAQDKGWSYGQYVDHLRNVRDAMQSADDELLLAVMLGQGAARAGLAALACRIGARSAVQFGVEEAIEAGLVKPGGKLEAVLRAMQGLLGRGTARSANSALEAIARATAAVDLEPGVIVAQDAGGYVLKNAGGIMTTINASGEVIVQRGTDTLLHVIPK